MFERIYFALWGLLLLAMALIFALGNLTAFGIVVFGFLAFGLTFMGMIGVLPNWVGHQIHPKH